MHENMCLGGRQDVAVVKVAVAIFVVEQPCMHIRLTLTDLLQGLFPPGGMKFNRCASFLLPYAPQVDNETRRFSTFVGILEGYAV